MKLSLVCLCVTFSLSIALAKDEPIVETSLGKLKGSVLKTSKNHEFMAFRGIRYAQAPIGDKRFKAPVSVTTWGNSILDATKDGYVCPQPRYPRESMSEDCLVLNVYTRDLSASKTVMVYIHGGSNFLGTSHSELESGPGLLMNQDIVLVTMNYRLGALGFLSTKNEDARGNYGYLDQVMALQWVQDHISNFGGNQKSVTIFGMSAGGMAVTLHMASPLSKGLFHKAIAMSGSATNHFTVDNLHWTRKLAKLVSCPLYNSKNVVDCLRNVSWEKIIDACKTYEPYGFIDLKWNYEVDGHFLLDTPTNVFAKGEFNKVPVMTGITKDELAFFNIYQHASNIGFLNDISLNFEKYAPEVLTFELDKNAVEKSKKIQKFYLKDKLIQDQPFGNFGEIFSDAIIGHGVYRLVHLARKYVDVYYYRFDYSGKFSIFPDENGKPRGVLHADDLQYIFKWDERDLDDSDVFMAERYGKWWASFSETGVPSDVNGVKWLPSTKENVYCLYNDKEIQLGEEPFLERYRLWDELFPVETSENSVKNDEL
ncbi:juvenile hormone esterase-like [Episyrphus balteatus]|uniref:juvenile hormone esterase-like n=1 Tax=Episyrphus balteatus TaxID=286459 RepID=UPI002485CDA2|nr:juvenile hormone esterase-like [Episyrphus balteatus]